MNRNLLLRRGWLAPLLLSLFVDNVRGTPVRSAAVLAAAAWSLAVLFRAARRPAGGLLVPLFVLWSAAGLFFSVYLSNSLNELSLLAAAWALGWGASLLFADRPAEKFFFARALVSLALLKAALALFLPPPGGRFFLDPGNIGSANISFVPMFLVLALLAGVSLTGRPWRAALVLLLASTLWLCVRWNAMTALLGLAVGLPLEAAFRFGRRELIAVAAAAGVAVLGLFFSDASPRWLRYNPDDPARMERLSIWSDSLVYARDHAAAGTGLGTYEQYYPQYKSLPGTRTANFAHNEWIQVLCETGVLGGLLVLLCLAGLWKRIRDKGREFPGAASGLLVIGLWANLYFVFRSDALLFTGAFFCAFLSRGETRPLSHAVRWGAVVLSVLLAAVVVPQGVAQVQERRGGAAWDHKDFASALDRFRSAAAWNPLEPRFLDEQVECLRSLDRKPETLPLLERAVSLKPRDVWLRRKLAVARLHLAGPAAARETYAPLLDLAPSVPQFRREMADLSGGAPPAGEARK